jgi:hypothetical protein
MVIKFVIAVTAGHNGFAFQSPVMNTGFDFAHSTTELLIIDADLTLDGSLSPVTIPLSR